MDPNFEIREAGLIDIPVLVTHREKMFKDIALMEHTYYDPIKLAEMSTRYATYLECHIPRKTVWGRLIVDKEIIIGSGCVTFVEWIPSPLHGDTERAYIHSVFVEPEFRHSGSCTQLVRTLCDELKNAGFFMVELHASDAGRRIYERLGFNGDTSMRKNL